jgi:hypothetical protein
VGWQLTLRVKEHSQSGSRKGQAVRAGAVARRPPVSRPNRPISGHPPPSPLPGVAEAEQGNRGPGARELR